MLGVGVAIHGTLTVVGDLRLAHMMAPILITRAMLTPTITVNVNGVAIFVLLVPTVILRWSIQRLLASRFPL